MTLRTTEGQSYPHLPETAHPSPTLPWKCTKFSAHCQTCRVWGSSAKRDPPFMAALRCDGTSSGFSPILCPAKGSSALSEVTVGWKDNISKAWWVQPGTMCRSMRRGGVQEFPPCNFQVRETLTQAVACSRCVTASDERGPQTCIKGLPGRSDHCDRPILCKPFSETRVSDTAMVLAGNKMREKRF